MGRCKVGGVIDYINLRRYGDGKQLDILSDNDAKSLTFTYNLATQGITGTQLRTCL